MKGVRIAQALARLFRVRLSGFVALSAAAGHAAGAYRLSWEIMLPSSACILLAAGSSALNQWQERKSDARMSRTHSRPIPSGQLSPRHALAISLVLILAAILLLAAFCGTWATIFGVCAVGLYNGLYTWMKRRTAFAAVPGALIGALGPAIGWVAAGGTPMSPALLAIAMVFFLWQVPHFWLLNLKYPSDYRDAGYPSPVDAMGGDSLYRVGLVWIACTALATLCLPLFGLLKSSLLYLVLCGTAILLAWMLMRTYRHTALDTVRYRVSYAGVNMFVFVTMVLLIVESGL